MKSFSVLRNFTSIALTACCAIGLSNVHALTYNLTDLGILPDQKAGASVPAAISGQAKNGQIQVAGTSGTSAFRYTSGKKIPMEDVGRNPFGSNSRGFGLNASGQVAGDSTLGKNKANHHAAIFSNGSTVDLGILKNGGPFSRANGINAFGQVAGSSSETFDGNKSRAFVGSKPGQSLGLIDIGTLGGAYAQALGINDSSHVTGNAQTADGSLSATSHAFIWHHATGMLDLGTLAGNFSYGTAINANNHVVGCSTINNSDDRVHAFLYDGDKMQDLGSLSGASLDTDLSYALGVNAADDVVGYSYTPFASKDSLNVVLGPWSVAFIYSQGLMVNLNDLIGSASKNYRLDSATGINDNGQIVAVAFDKSADAFHAVLLTPDPAGGAQ